MRLTLSPNPAVAYHTNHPERGGAGKPEVDFSTRTGMSVCVCVCVMGLLTLETDGIISEKRHIGTSRDAVKDKND